MNNQLQNATQTLCIFNDPKLGTQFSSFSPDTIEGKVRLYNAINAPDGRLADLINTPIDIRDVVVSKVSLAKKFNKDDKDSGDDWTEEADNTSREGFRVVIIDTQDKAYVATSTGIYNSICTLRSVFGTLHFEDGLKATVKQVKTKNGNTLNLSLVS